MYLSSVTQAGRKAGEVADSSFEGMEILLMYICSAARAGEKAEDILEVSLGWRTLFLCTSLTLLELAVKHKNYTKAYLEPQICKFGGSREV